jgi:hypothetical protein
MNLPPLTHIPPQPNHICLSTGNCTCSPEQKLRSLEIICKNDNPENRAVVTYTDGSIRSFTNLQAAVNYYTELYTPGKLPMEHLQALHKSETVEFLADSFKITDPDPGAHYRFQLRTPILQKDIAAGYTTAQLDPYRIARIYGITEFAQLTVLKKILCTGNRGHKALEQDLSDCISALQRWQELLKEDELLEQTLNKSARK